MQRLLSPVQVYLEREIADNGAIVAACLLSGASMLNTYPYLFTVF